jgi:hypothetical protein
MKRIQKISVIFSWVTLGLCVVFVLGVVAAIEKWIDRPWATGIAEVSAALVFLMVVSICICFLLDREKKKKAEEVNVEDDEFAGLGLDDDYVDDDYVDDAEEDQFEELEPLPAEPLASTDDADGIVDLDDADDDFEELEIT